MTDHAIACEIAPTVGDGAAAEGDVDATGTRVPGRHWLLRAARTRVVAVYDRTAPDWRLAVAGAVERWNAALGALAPGAASLPLLLGRALTTSPPLVLSLVVEGGGCAGLGVVPRRPGIYVCNVDWGPGTYNGLATPFVTSRSWPHTHAAKATFNDHTYQDWPLEDERRTSLATHELGHAVGIWTHAPWGADSAVGGRYHGPPGAWDIDYLARLYARCPERMVCRDGHWRRDNECGKRCRAC